MNDLKPFRIHVSQEAVNDLQNRLNHTRWPEEADGSDWNYGPNPDYMKVLVSYWQSDFDWRTQEGKLNELPQFTAQVKGTTIHFVHAKSNNPKATPLLLVHGWPDSIYRYHKVIPLLIDSFDLVVPSIPGFGFSSRKTVPSSEVANLFAALMTEVLGYKLFAVSGGDIGTNIIKAMALQHSHLLKAIHLTDVGYPNGREDPDTMTKAEKQFSKDTRQWFMSEGAYLMMQATKSGTIAYSLLDSPVGLAAWIVSMIHSQADGDNVEAAFGGRDELLTNIALYWFTQTAGTAARIYSLDAKAGQTQPPAKSNVPAGITLYPRELQFPKEWAERSFHVCSYEQMPLGGHFAALEEPKLFADSLRRFFASVLPTANG